MNRNLRRIVRWSCFLVGLSWLVLTSLGEFFDVEALQVTIFERNKALYMAIRRCPGSFKTRLRCASRLLLDHDHHSFVFWGGKVGWVSIPPVMLYIGFNLWIRRRDRIEQAERQERRSARVKKRAHLRERHEEVGEARLENAKRARADAAEAKRKPPLLVLAASNDEAMKRQITEILSQAGSLVIPSAAEDWSAGFASIRYQVVVAEPGDFGFQPFYEVAAEMRAPGRVLIVAVSAKFAGLSLEAAEKVAEECGADGVLGKPVEPAQLAALFKTLLERSRRPPKPPPELEDDEDDEA